MLTKIIIMKKVVAVTFVLFFALMLGTTENLSAQRYDEAQYEYSDSANGIIYQMYLRFKGYQVQVWMKTHTAKEWTEYAVTSSNNETISVKNGASTYHLRLDPANEDVVVLFSGDYKNSWKYLKK
jgi:hypothetical protein